MEDQTNNIPGATGDPLSPDALKELFLFSTFIFVASALLVQFILTLQTALLLLHYSISFTYSLFWISYQFTDFGTWSFRKIIIVYGSGMLILFLAGLLLLNARTRYWKKNLILRWLSFILINMLPTGLVAGILIYQESGMAYAWLFQNLIVRAVIAFFALLVIIIFRHYWIEQFLKSAYSKAFLEDERNQKKFIKYAMILPWVAGTLALMLFGIPRHAWFWMVSLAGLGFVILPLFQDRMLHSNIMIFKSKKVIFPVRHPLVYILSILGILWIASLFQINF